MDQGQKNLTWAKSGHFFVARVRSGQLSLGIENFLLKIPNFSIFSFQVKKISLSRVKEGSASYLLRV